MIQLIDCADRDEILLRRKIAISRLDSLQAATAVAYDLILAIIEHVSVARAALEQLFHVFGEPFRESIVQHLNGSQTEDRLLCSRPSPVQSSFRRAPLRTLVAYTAQMPWRLLWRRYRFVAGWHAMFERVTAVRN